MKKLNPSVLKTSGPLMATLATILFAPALAGAATIIDRLPYTITAPGRYELQRDLTTNGSNGITVQAANVVIDLKGFSITGDGTANGVAVASQTNVTVRNGMISGFYIGVVLVGVQSRAINLQLVNNDFGVATGGKACAVQDCFIVGLGTNHTGVGVGLYKSSSGILVKGNQISEFMTGINDFSADGFHAFTGNYIANGEYGIVASSNDLFQGNVVTNCAVPFSGGQAVGTENGGN